MLLISAPMPVPQEAGKYAMQNLHMAVGRCIYTYKMFKIYNKRLSLLKIQYKLFANPRPPPLPCTISKCLVLKNRY